MFERFTEKARRVVGAAEAQARDATAGEIRPEHLLMALLAEPDCVAVRVLESLGAPADAVRERLDRNRARHVDGLDEEDAEALRAIGIDLNEVVRRIDRNLGGLAAPAGRLRFSRGAKKALGLALREAVALRHNYIGTEHLLLGLARCDDTVVSETFDALSLRRPDLRVAVVEALRRAG
jgi:ATP-dependent Clp protease ATP-binding subunit ClpA